MNLIEKVCLKSDIIYIEIKGIIYWLYIITFGILIGIIIFYINYKKNQKRYYNTYMYNMMLKEI